MGIPEPKEFQSAARTLGKILITLLIVGGIAVFFLGYFAKIVVDIFF